MEMGEIEYIPVLNIFYFIGKIYLNYNLQLKPKLILSPQFFKKYFNQAKIQMFNYIKKVSI